MSNRVMGVDCSSKAVAVVELDGERVTEVAFLEVGVRGLGWQGRLGKLANIASTFFARPAALLYIEEAPLGRSFRSSLEVSYVVGCVMVEAMRHGHLVVPVNPTVWKKHTTGNGHADKETVKEWAWRYVLQPGGLTERPKQQDIYDAACIAAFARQNLCFFPGAPNVEDAEAARL